LGIGHWQSYALIIPRVRVLTLEGPMPNIRGPELLILVLVVVLLFGAKRLPDAARSVGRSLRIFKAETKGLVDGETSPEPTAATTATTATPAQPVALPPAQQPVAPPVAGSPVADVAAGDNALAPDSDAAPSSLQTQPPSQA
jgi:sec-independent protein translocase protein TatA